MGARRAARLRFAPGPWAKDALLALVCIGALLAGLAYWAYQKLPDLPLTVDKLGYEHTATFAYTVNTDPSSIYPDGRVTSAALVSTSTEGQGPRVLAAPARSLDLDVNYALGSPVPGDVSGTFSATMELSAGDIWSKSYELAAPSEFQGGAYQATLHIDFAQLREQLLAIEEETGYRAGAYTVTILPAVHVRGMIAGSEIDDTFEPGFTVRMDSSQITLDPSLEREDPHKITGQVLQEQMIGWRDWRLTVMEAREVGLYGAVACLALAGLLAAMIYLGLGLSRAEQIRAQYGNMVVSVADVDFSQVRLVELASISDLKRLASLDGQVILHRQLDETSDVFFVDHGTVAYTYSVRREAKGK
ncbi:MAG: DUF5305 family protein [Anaerolineae bacterium]